MDVFFVSFGCKVNQYETEYLKQAFVSAGFGLSASPGSAGVIIINSCTVTESGDNRSLKALRQMRKAAPEAVIVLTGCLPQTAKDKDGFADADIITGTQDRKNLLPMVLDFLETRKRSVSVREYKGTEPFEEFVCEAYESKTRAFVKIQDGCDRFCSYCIIPYARGRCRSKPLDTLKKEVTHLAEKGHKEIVLVGINLDFYGEEYGLSLADAAEMCCGIDGVERLRLGSLEPEMMTDETLRRLAALEKFCPQFHLSLQSGCDRTLKAMNRHYTCNEYIKLTQKIRSYFPGCVFTTDIMVGFPGETEDDFAETMKFAKKIGFAKIHVFPYSVRPGTAAAKMKGHLPERVKTERMKRLKALGDELSRKYCESLIGETLPVLFERETDPDFHTGHTPCHTVVKVYEKNFQKSLKKEIFYVKIIDSGSNSCIGEIVDKPVQYRINIKP